MNGKEEKISTILHKALEELSKKLAEVIHSIPEIIRDFENREEEKAYAKLEGFKFTK